MCFNGANIIFFYCQNCGICAFSSTAEQQLYQRLHTTTATPSCDFSVEILENPQSVAKHHCQVKSEVKLKDDVLPGTVSTLNEPPTASWKGASTQTHSHMKKASSSSGKPIQITKKLTVKAVKTLDAISSTWTVPHDDMAYLLDLESLPTRPSGETYTMDAYIHSEVS